MAKPGQQLPPHSTVASPKVCPTAGGRRRRRLPRPQQAQSKSLPHRWRRRRRIRSSPLARRIAKEHGIDLGRIAGTGAEGRITKDDVLRAANSPVAHISVQKAAATPVPQVRRRLISRPLPADPVPLTRMRAIIAERMVESVRVSPHVYTVYKVDMTRIARLREQHKAAFEQRHGVKLTFMPFIAAAAVAALRRFPIVNASLENAAQGLAIRYHRNIDLGIAVALDWGLIVPVIRQAEQRSFADLARTIADLALARPNQKTLARRGRRVDIHAHKRRHLLAASSPRRSSISPSRPSSPSAA